MNLPTTPSGEAASPFLTRQFWLITAGAVAVFVGLRLLPTTRT